MPTQDLDADKPTEEFDLVVLGTGQAGAAPASKCRAAGWTVAVVDDQPYGGTCAVRGCDPKKVLVGAADLVAWNTRMIGHGVAGGATIDWPELMQFKRSFTDPIPSRRENALKASGVVTFHGKARFISDSVIAIGERHLKAKHVVIATGASPRPLSIPGEHYVVSSTEFLELETLPRRIVYIGAGFVSLEFSHVACRAGSNAVVLGRSRPLPRVDSDLVGRLVQHTRKTGIDLRLGTEVTAVERNEVSGTFIVTSRSGEVDSVIEADLVVHGAGRIPNTARLDCAAANVSIDGRGAVEVNEFLQSISNPRVYAAGDVALPPGSLPLTPAAAHEGAIVASNLLRGNTKRPDYRGIPSVVFTLPPLAAVGQTEADARAGASEVKVRCENTADWYGNRRVRQPVGMYKTIVDVESDRVLGAHVLGQHADEVINIFALAIRFGLPASELKRMTYAYPTTGADVPYML
jgi:glutathione reductase (NADPH)